MPRMQNAGYTAFEEFFLEVARIGGRWSVSWKREAERGISVAKRWY